MFRGTAFGETADAVQVRPDDAALRTVWSRQCGIRRSEQCQHRRACRRRYVHRSAVIADQQFRMADDLDQSARRGLSGKIREADRRRGIPDLGAKFFFRRTAQQDKIMIRKPLGDPECGRGKEFRRPLLGFPTGPRRDGDPFFALVSSYVDAVLCGIAGDLSGAGIQPLFADTFFLNAGSYLADARRFGLPVVFPACSAGGIARLELRIGYPPVFSGYPESAGLLRSIFPGIDSVDPCGDFSAGKVFAGS